MGVGSFLPACAAYNQKTWYLEEVNRDRIEQIEKEREAERRLVQLREPSEESQKEALRRLRELGPVARPLLVNRLALEGPETGVRVAQALRTLADPDAVPEILKVWPTLVHPEVRAETADTLAALGTRAITLHLIRFFEEEKVALVRARLAQALGTLRDPRAVEPLARGLVDEPVIVAQAIADALGEIGDLRAVPWLIERWNLFPSYGGVPHKVEIARILGRLRTPLAIPHLSRELKNSPSPLVRAACAKALGEIAYPAAVPALIESLLDPSRLVFWESHQALVKITGIDNSQSGADADETQRLTHRKWKEWYEARER